MKTSQIEARDQALAHGLASLTGSHRRTLEAMFRHPTAHNLEWKGVVSLINKGVEPKGGDEFSFEIGGKHHLMRKPHNKDLTSADVIELRQFFQTS